MTPTYRTINSSSPPSFPFELNNISEDHDLNHPLISPNYQDASSSFQYSSCQIFFNSTTTQDHQTGYYHHTEYYQPQHQPEVVNYALGGGSYELEKTNKAEHGLKLSLWKKEDKYENENENENENEKNPLKWMSSKMRLMQKMKNSDRASAKNTNPTILKLGDDQKQLILSSPDDSSSNSSSNNSTNTIPIRVCSDCNTTKTPLWRSGPKGPKSLCNACGIRQRKARRAMAAAANGTTHTAETSSSSIKIKVQQKEKITKVSTNNQVRPYKKRCKFVTAHDHGSSSSNNSTAPNNKKLGFEDVLINLSKNLAIHQVFPQDEKEAAILLMALSCGLVHS